MNWKFWKKKKQEEYLLDIFSKEVNMPTLARWYLYDTEIAYPNKVASLMGMIPISDEGEAQEVSASSIRTDRVEPFLAFINTMAEINAMTMSAAQSRVLGESNTELDDEELAEAQAVIEDMYVKIGFLAIYSAFCAALELGILENPGVYSTVEASREQQ